jgi:hypothetical protein
MVLPVTHAAVLSEVGEHGMEEHTVTLMRAPAVVKSVIRSVNAK